jgi:hypothetical protein
MSSNESGIKSSKTNNASKEKDTESEKKNNSFFNPELISKRNVIINTSTSKEMYSFPLSRRFNDRKRDNSPFFYNIPSSLSKRATSLGFGNKIVFNQNTITPGPGSYNHMQINIKGSYVSSELPNSPINKFGSETRFRKVRNINETPAPNAYHVESMIKGNGIIYNSRYNSNLGKSMGKKLERVGNSIISPGPGSYKFMNLNKEGKYASSTLANSVQNKFGKEIRFKQNKGNGYPAPNAYKLESMIKGNGVMYNSRYNNNLGKTMGMKFNNRCKDITPGPGAYEFFSDFEGFFKYGGKNYNNLKKLTISTSQKIDEEKSKKE